ncbi:hypothetical protein ZOSMA_78G00320 [Zostera marina]|uniref:Uncharacterized protein n=1 Tax=Zostera marina TaxID=29655 RepID=A0A0K9NNB4_ZOSMR|nr:hypothetical protein ZOSMA_78G00320 [Zostera marina]
MKFIVDEQLENKWIEDEKMDMDRIIEDEMPDDMPLNPFLPKLNKNKENLVIKVRKRGRRWRMKKKKFLGQLSF